MECNKCGADLYKFQDEWYCRNTACSNSKEDSINHPSHYTFGKIEVIDVIDDWKLSYELSSVIKYVARAGKKDPLRTIEDLKKAAWYLNREIENLGK